MDNFTYFYIWLIVITAIIVVDFVRTLLFVTFRADKYEDVLAKKIAKEVKDHIDKFRTKA